MWNAPEALRVPRLATILGTLDLIQVTDSSSAQSTYILPFAKYVLLNMEKGKSFGISSNQVSERFVSSNSITKQNRNGLTTLFLC